jgi:hypothetical protein
MPFPVDPKYIDAAQEKLSTIFPSMFRGKMIRENGGSVQAVDDDWHLFPFLDSSDRKRLARTCNDIVLETKRMREWPNFPKDAIAIASNGSADRLILTPKTDVPNELDPAVYWWDHETGEISKVAEDFAELLGMA